MKSKIKIAIGIVLVVAIAAVAGWFVASKIDSTTDTPAKSGTHAEQSTGTNDQSKSTDGQDAPSPSGFQAPAMTDDEAKQLSAHLVSQDDATYRSAWAVEKEQEIPPVAPAGTTIDINLSTFTSLDTAGRVDSVITVPGQSPENWRLLLLYIDGQWRLYSMKAV